MEAAKFTTTQPEIHVIKREAVKEAAEVKNFVQPTSQPKRPSSVIPEHVTVSVVIPAMNEEKNLPHLLPLIPEWVHEIVLVDGNSKDRTVEVAREICPRIRIIQQEGRGKGAALRTGFLKSTGDIIVMLDADGSMDPREIPSFVGALLAGADVVKGSRFVQGAGTTDMPLYRKLGNAALTTAANILFGTAYTDITYGFNAAWRHSAPGLALEIDGWSHEIVNILRAARHGLKVVEVACFEHSRIAGEAKLQAFSAGWAILKEMVRERFGQPKKWVLWERRMVVGDTTVTPALQVLRNEMLALLNSQQNLTEGERQTAFEALHMAFDAVMALDTDHPDVQAMKREYREKYSAQRFQGFVASLQATGKPATLPSKPAGLPAYETEPATQPALPIPAAILEPETAAAPAQPAPVAARVSEPATQPALPALHAKRDLTPTQPARRAMPLLSVFKKTIIDLRGSQTTAVALAKQEVKAPPHTQPFTLN